MIRVFVALCIAICVGPLALAERLTLESEPVQGVLALLDSEDFAQRELAESQLRELFADDPSGLIQLVRDGDLSSEQRMRVLRVAKQQFSRGERAAIGIRMSNLNQPGQFWQGRGIQITETIEGFPVRLLEQLKPGDVILQLGESDLREGSSQKKSEQLRREVVSREPGEKLGVVLLRPAVFNGNEPPRTEEQLIAPQEMETTVTLGKWSDLQGGNLRAGGRPSADSIEQAWEARLEREGIDAREDQPEVLSSIRDGKVWAKTRGITNFPSPRFFVSAESGIAALTAFTQVASKGKPEDLKMARQRTNALSQQMIAPEPQPLADADGLDARTLATIRRLTETKRQEQQLRREADDAERAAMDRELIRDELRRVIEQRNQLETELRTLLVDANDAEK